MTATANAALPASLPALERLIALSDHFRHPLFSFRAAASAAPPHKEWFHFCVLGDGLDLFINYSIMETPPPRPGAPLARARVTVLARTADGWEGAVDPVADDEVVIRRSRIDARFGDANRMCFERGAFHLTATLRERPVSLALVLAPETMPLMRPNTPVDDGPIHWLVVPRLAATGTVRVGERSFRLDGAPTYHDHNWGRWLWGHDFGWQWGFALPGAPPGRSPWSVAFVRLVDRARTRDLGHGLFLWEGARQRRIFREGEVTIRPSGRLAPRVPPRFPRAAGLLVSGTGTDVPRTLDVVASGWGDEVRCRFEAEDLAEIVVPDERDLGVTIIHEVRGRLHVEGRVGGRALSLDGPSVFEFVGHG